MQCCESFVAKRVVVCCVKYSQPWVCAQDVSSPHVTKDVSLLQVGCELAGGLPDAAPQHSTVAANSAPLAAYPPAPDMSHMSSYYNAYPDYRPPHPPDEYPGAPGGQGGGGAGGGHCGQEYDPRMPPTHPYYTQQGYPRYPPYDRLMNNYYNAQTPQHPHTPHGMQPHEAHDYRDPSPAAPTCMGQQASPPVQQYSSCKMAGQGPPQQPQQPQQQQAQQQPPGMDPNGGPPQDTSLHMAAQDHQGWPAQQQPQQQQNASSALPSPLYPWMRSQFGEYYLFIHPNVHGFIPTMSHASHILLALVSHPSGTFAVLLYCRLSTRFKLVK